MSLFEKLLIPLLDSHLTKEDVSPEAGFFGCYTEDPDKPYNEGVFLLYDDSIRTSQSVKTWNKLYASKTKAKEYFKRINNHTYRVYYFPLFNLGIKQILNGHRPTNTSDKTVIGLFWRYEDGQINKFLCMPAETFGNEPIVMPCSDYRVSRNELVQQRETKVVIPTTKASLLCILTLYKSRLNTYPIFLNLFI